MLIISPYLCLRKVVNDVQVEKSENCRHFHDDEKTKLLHPTQSDNAWKFIDRGPYSSVSQTKVSVRLAVIKCCDTFGEQFASVATSRTVRLADRPCSTVCRRANVPLP